MRTDDTCLIVSCEVSLEDPLSGKGQNTWTSFAAVSAVPGKLGLIMNWSPVMVWCTFAFLRTEVISLIQCCAIRCIGHSGMNQAGLQVLVWMKSRHVTWSKLISDWISHRHSHDQCEGWLVARWSRKQGTRSIPSHHEQGDLLNSELGFSYIIFLVRKIQGVKKTKKYSEENGKLREYQRQ